MAMATSCSCCVPLCIFALVYCNEIGMQNKGIELRHTIETIYRITVAAFTNMV